MNLVGNTPHKITLKMKPKSTSLSRFFLRKSFLFSCLFSLKPERRVAWQCSRKHKRQVQEAIIFCAHIFQMIIPPLFNSHARLPVSNFLFWKLFRLVNSTLEPWPCRWYILSRSLSLNVCVASLQSLGKVNRCSWQGKLKVSSSVFKKTDPIQRVTLVPIYKLLVITNSITLLVHEEASFWQKLKSSRSEYNFSGT